MDGSVYEWKVLSSKREKECVLKNCAYTSVSMSPDLKSVYAVGSDRTLKEINLNEATVSNSLLAAPAIVCIFKVVQKFTKSPCRYFVKIGQSPYTIVHGLWSKITRRESSIFIIFSDTYTYAYVV